MNAERRKHEGRPRRSSSFIVHRSSFAGRRGFTLLELLVVVAVIALLLSILLPSLAAAREKAKATVCRSNVRQIVLANHYYQDDNRGVYCPGSADFLFNLNRWHGTRSNPGEPFQPSRGPLVPYLGEGGAIRSCPTFDTSPLGSSAGFERGNGGYGYNHAFLGMRLRETPGGAYVVVSDRAGAYADRVTTPAGTLMFADTAFASGTLIEYSFAEPRFHPQYPTFRSDPSIHFRHRRQASIAWCDGHVDSQTRSFTWRSGFYPTDPEKLDIGWFGTADDNSVFDLK